MSVQVIRKRQSLTVTPLRSDFKQTIKMPVEGLWLCVNVNGKPLALNLITTTTIIMIIIIIIIIKKKKKEGEEEEERRRRRRKKEK